MTTTLTFTHQNRHRYTAINQDNTRIYYIKKNRHFHWQLDTHNIPKRHPQIPAANPNRTDHTHTLRTAIRTAETLEAFITREETRDHWLNLTNNPEATLTDQTAAYLAYRTADHTYQKLLAR